MDEIKHPSTSALEKMFDGDAVILDITDTTGKQGGRWRTVAASDAAGLDFALTPL